MPSRSPLKIPGASSLIPSPMTTSPQTSVMSNMPRMASQAAASAASLSPFPIHPMQFSAAISVARRKSNSTRRWMSIAMMSTSSGKKRCMPPGSPGILTDFVGPCMASRMVFGPSSHAWKRALERRHFRYGSRVVSIFTLTGSREFGLAMLVLGLRFGLIDEWH